MVRLNARSPKFSGETAEAEGAGWLTNSQSPPAFKSMAYDQITGRQTKREVFGAYGIDPEILGDSCILSFAEMLRAKAAREEGLRVYA